MYQDTTATRKIFALKKRIRAVRGGTSASKTISILFWLIDYCQSTKGDLCTVVSESYPHLSDGAMRDFKNIMTDKGYWDDERWHDTKHTYTFESGSQLEFRAIDTYGKAHGPRRDVLFINECNNMEYRIADQLITRTRKIVWLDWNPSEEFWFDQELMPTRKDIDFITLTYLDNEGLDANTIDEIESHKHNKAWWQVYGLGQLGDVEGRIFTGWAIVDGIPHEARLERRGLDFGFTNDPAAIVDIYYYNGGYILDERLYQRRMGNDKLGTFISNMDGSDTLVVADSAEPKSIEDLRTQGIGVIGAIKGPGSLNLSVQHMQDLRISYTRTSFNLQKEYRRYFWKFDRDGNMLKVPEGGFDHCLDAARYALESLRPAEDDEEYEELSTGNASALQY